MTVTTNRWKLGLFVTLGVALAIVTLIWLGAAQFKRVNVPAVTYLDESVQGLDPGAAVKFRGMTLGAVTELRVAPDERHLEVHFDLFFDVIEAMGFTPEDPARTRRLISGDAPLDPGNLRVQIAVAGITGLRFLQISRVDETQFPVPEYDFEVPPNYFPSRPSTFKSIEEGLTVAVEVLPQVMKDIRNLIENIDGVVSELDVDTMGDRIYSVLDDAQRALEELAAAIKEVRADDGPVQRLVDRANGAIAQAEKTLTAAKIEELSSSLTRTSTAMGDLTLDVGDMSGEMQQTLVALRRAMESLEDLTAMLERNPEAFLAGKGDSKEETPHQ